MGEQGEFRFYGDYRPFDGGCGYTVTDPVITLDDGRRLYFLVEETETGQYGVKLCLTEQAAAEAGMSRRRPVRFPVYFTQAELKAILDMSCGIAVGDYRWTNETLAASESVGSKAAELLGRLKKRRKTSPQTDGRSRERVQT